MAEGHPAMFKPFLATGTTRLVVISVQRTPLAFHDWHLYDYY